MPLNPILEVEIFDVWGIDFIGSFSSSIDNQYILVCDGLCLEVGKGCTDQNE